MSQNELLKSNEELETFAYAASHDMREPLRMITNYIQLIQKRLKDTLDDKMNQYFDYAAEGSLRMQKTIDDILDYAKMKFDTEDYTKIELNKILDKTIRNLEIPIKNSGAKINFQDIPDTVHGSENHILRLFQNLIENAIKFRNEKEPEITIGAKEKNNEFIFEIQDNGIGIDPEHSKNVFQAFKRMHNRQKYPGTGIGLSQCKKIVEAHNGKIWIESNVNHGTSVFFSIPFR
ncbi:MAG: ATP-binding protein [Spirochaetia bacterium]|nr:ATP-binding protein [Spirochaetia bacterium]